MHRADRFAKPHSFGGGLGVGDGVVTLAGLVLIVALVTYCIVTRCDVQPDPERTERVAVTDEDGLRSSEPTR